MKSFALAFLTTVSCSFAFAGQVLESCRVTAFDRDLFEAGVRKGSEFSIEVDGKNATARLGGWAWSEIVKKNPKPAPRLLSEYLVTENPTVNNPQPEAYLFRKFNKRTGDSSKYVGGFYSTRNLKEPVVTLSCK